MLNDCLHGRDRWVLLTYGALSTVPGAQDVVGGGSEGDGPRPWGKPPKVILSFCPATRPPKQSAVPVADHTSETSSSKAAAGTQRGLS